MGEGYDVNWHTRMLYARGRSGFGCRVWRCRPMSTGNKAILIHGAALFSAVLAVYFLFSKWANADVTRLEEARGVDAARQLLAAWENEAVNLGAVCRDWAQWDDTYEFLRSRDRRYVKANLTPDVFRNLRLNYFLLYDSAGGLVLAAGCDPCFYRLQDADEGFADLVRGVTLNSRRERGEVLILSPAGAFLVAFQPVLPSDGVGEKRGTLAFARLIDRGELARLSGATRLPVEGYLWRDFSVRQEGADATGRLPAKSVMAVAADERYITGYALIKDYKGEPALVLKTTLRRDVLPYARRSRRWALVIVLIVAAVFFGGTWFMMTVFVFRPLKGFVRELSIAARTKRLPRNLTVGYGGIVDELSAGVSELLAAVNEAQTKLVESEKRFRVLAENIADVIWTTDLNLNFTYVSPAGERFNGYRPEELIGKSAAEVLSPAGMETASRVLAEELPRAGRRELPTDYVRTLELEHRHKDGHTFWAEVKASFIYGEDGALLGILGVTRDITARKLLEDELRAARDELEARVMERTADLIATNERLINEINERRRAEAALRDSEARYRSVVENMQAGAVILQDGVIKFVNAYLANMLSHCPSDLLGRSARSVFGEMDYELVSGTAREVEVVTAGGKKVPVSYAVSAVNYEGKPAKLVVLRDLTREKEQTRALNEQRWILDNVLSHMSEMVYVVDLESYEIIFANGAALRAAGENVVGKKCYEAIWNLVDVCFKCCLGARASGKSECVKEGFNERLGLWLRCKYTLIPWLDGRTVVCIVADDISESKALEEEIIAHNKTLNKIVQERTSELEQKNRELESFAYSVSHDLRAPLRSLEGFSQVLLEDYQHVLDEEGMDYLTRINKAAARMDNLISDLLTYSRLGQRGVHIEDVDMEELVRQSIEDLQPAIREAGAEVVVAGRLPRVKGDASMLHVLWNNLLSNAIKFRRPGIKPEVVISAEVGDEAVTFAVADNGIGIDPRYKEKVFHIFQRLHSEEEYPGTGIGLASAEKVVAAHGGSIWFESEPGQGATFYFRLPVNGSPDEQGDK